MTGKNVFELTDISQCEIEGNQIKTTETPSKRKGPHRFQKGNNANPSGRPKLTPDQKIQREQVIEACRAASHKALETLLDLMVNAPQASVRMQAAEALLDRGWGKALQVTENHNINENVDALAPDEAYRVMMQKKAAA